MAASKSFLFRYSNPLAAKPDEVCPSGTGELVPVTLHYGPGARYAKGGLASKALAVKGAGRYGDSKLVHVNEDEFHQMRELWGDPSINPETGQPEFFLGALLGIVKAVAPAIIGGLFGGGGGGGGQGEQQSILKGPMTAGNSPVAQAAQGAGARIGSMPDKLANAYTATPVDTPAPLSQLFTKHRGRDPNDDSLPGGLG